MALRKVAILGVGHSRFGARLDVNLPELAFESIREALDDVDVAREEIGFMAVGTLGTWYEESLPAVVISEYAGLNPTGLVRTEAACASGSSAVHSAYMSVASEQADVALAVGVEKMSEVDTGTAVELMGRAGSYLWEFENFGLTFPGYYAMYATAHMAKYGTTEEQLAQVAVKNHKYGAMNPLAQYQREIDLRTVRESPVVAWPLRLYDCCPITDGSASVILASEKTARKANDAPIWVKGIGVASDTANLSKREDYTSIRSTVKASRRAYERADVEPESFDVACVHDCFTIAEILAYEDLGLCEKGEGGRFVEEGETYLGGTIPVNVDGGLKAKGHPIGATGCSMMVEITRQLRGEAGSRQAEIASGLGLVHNVGGTGHTCYVTVLGREV